MGGCVLEEKRSNVVHKRVTWFRNLEYAPLYSLNVFVKNHFLVNLKATLQKIGT